MEKILEKFLLVATSFYIDFVEKERGGVVCWLKSKKLAQNSYI